MSILAMFILIALAILLWFVLLQKLKTKPWLEQGIAIESAYNATSYPTQVIGLGVFLAVVTALFSLFAAAYHMRMNVPDWAHLPIPKLLWVNTGLLLLSSIAMQWAWSASDRFLANRSAATANIAVNLQHNLTSVRQGLMAGGCFALAFLAGQLMAWRQLDTNGFFFSCSPASAFFYVLTGLHGIHLLGGLLVWGKTTTAIYRDDLLNRSASAGALFLRVKLCAIYWHYLLLLWLALFALLSLT